MDEIDDLSRMLERINSDAAACFEVPISEVAKSHENVQTHLQRRIIRNRASASLSDLMERVKAAIQTYRVDAEDIDDFRTLRLACLGCATAVRPENYLLLGDSAALDRLLGALARFEHHPRTFRKLYGCLLNAYFTQQQQLTSTKPIGVDKGRKQLRTFLASTLEIFSFTEPVLDWVQTLKDFPTLLGERPGEPFAERILAGDWSTFQGVCQKLGLTGDTWLAAEVIRSAADAATAGTDKRFVACIPTLLHALRDQRFAALRDEVLAKLLDHYALNTDRVLHTELRDFAVAAWKNPWLTSNEAAWRRVSPDAREMVAGWLKLDLISEFFLLLADEGKGDRRRFEFWGRYLKQIEDMYFLLGSTTKDSRDRDIVSFRNKLEGRMLELTGTSANAFIMIIGSAAVVEFSKTGKAAYAYLREAIPVKLTGATVAVRDLRSESCEARMIHRDAQGYTWEQRFEDQLDSTFGIRPDHGRTTSMHDTLQRVGFQRNQQSGTKSSFDESEFRLMVQTFGLRWQDLRTKGGNLWVLTESSSPIVVEHLLKWSFVHKPGKGWWKPVD